MIGIKGMKMPKSCKECAFCEDFCEEIFCQMESVSIKDENIRQSFCPLVDLGKEDMSWEELVENVEKLKIFKTWNNYEERIPLAHFVIDDEITPSVFYLNFLGETRDWVFYKNGLVLLRYSNLTANNSKIEIEIQQTSTNYKMWQIIKALTGENK